VRRLVAIALLLVLPACGAASRAEYAASSPSTVTRASDDYYQDEAGAAGVSYGGVEERNADVPAQYAQNQQTAAQESATDAIAQPLLIYTADLTVAVHHVTAKQDRVEAIASELGGHLSQRTNDTIVIRIPARAFDGAMAQIQALGDVLSRNIQVQDVSEEFRDTETRIQTLEAMRRRLEELLRQANNVEAALAVEQQLERITVELERLRGRLRFLADRVAFSTITVRFSERTETREPQFRLPFPWLDSLGLQRLLQL